MGEKIAFQPLTTQDRVTVLLYRAGIILSAVLVSVLALLVSRSGAGAAPGGVLPDVLGYGLYASVGLCVFFIHLYVGAFKRYLMNLYYISLGFLIVLLVVGKGSPSAVLAREPFGPLLLLPLAGCLGFVTAKEAFCFRLIEGYLLTVLMPLYLLLVAGGILPRGGASSGLALIAVLLIVFTLRKAFMPVAYDIGDKSAYR